MTARRVSVLGRRIYSDSRGMRGALALARYGAATVAPNPAVGALVVHNHEVVGYGWHRRAGGDHAEVEAIRMAGARARGATLFVTLEPCNHHGKTPPCTEAILSAGIARVVVGIGDPNPLVAGGGGAFLQSQGVEISWSEHADAVADLDLDWLTRLRQKERPAVSWWFPLRLDGSYGELSQCLGLFESTAGRARLKRFVSLGGMIVVKPTEVARLQETIPAIAAGIVGWEGPLNVGLERHWAAGARHLALVGGEWVAELAPRPDQIDKLVAVHLPEFGSGMGRSCEWSGQLELQRSYRAGRWAVSVYCCAKEG